MPVSPLGTGSRRRKLQTPMAYSSTLSILDPYRDEVTFRCGMGFVLEDFSLLGRVEGFQAPSGLSIWELPHKWRNWHWDGSWGVGELAQVSVTCLGKTLPLPAPWRRQNRSFTPIRYILPPEF